MPRIPPPDSNGRILSHLDGGIEASFNRWDWPGLSVSYSAKTGDTCYINRSSAVKFLQEHGIAVDWYSRKPVILAEIEKLCPAASKAEEISRSKLGALVRGHQVRSRTVLPARVRPFLEKRFINSPSEKDSSQMEILICREINEKLAERGNFGKSFLINSLDGRVRLDYPLEEYGKLEKAFPTNLKMDLWITISEDGKRVSLQFKPQDSLLLGQGGYRQVFAAEEVVIGMQPTKDEQGYSRKTAKTPSVRVIGVEDQLLPSSSGYKRVERGAQVHKTSYSKLAEAKKRGLFKEVYITSPHETLGAGTAKQVRYGTDMEKLIKTGKLTQGFSQEIVEVQASRVQLLQCVRDVALALKWLNDQGITHRDVKVGNINVSWGDDDKGVKRPIAYLADFDFARKGFGYDPQAFDYDYYVWDPCCSSANITTPYTDLYGAVEIFCEVMAPRVGWKEFDEAKKAIQRDVARGKSFQPEPYTPKGLDRYQKEAFDAFCGICYESALLLKELKKRSSFPKSIGPEQVQAAMTSLKNRGLLRHSMDTLIGLIDRELRRNI